MTCSSVGKDLAVEVNCAGAGLGESNDDPSDSRLSAAALADQTEAFAALDVETHAVHRTALTPVSSRKCHPKTVNNKKRLILRHGYQVRFELPGCGDVRQRNDRAANRAVAHRCREQGTRPGIASSGVPQPNDLAG